MVVQGLGRHRLSGADQEVAASGRVHGALLRHAGDQHLVLRTHQAGMGQAVVPQSARCESRSSCSPPSSIARLPTRPSRLSKALRRDHPRRPRRRTARPKLGWIPSRTKTCWALCWCSFQSRSRTPTRNRDYLDALLDKFRQYPLVVEVRHNSWTNEGTLRYFAQKGVAFCNIDQPLLGKAVMPSDHVTSPIGYVRLHGRNYEQWFDSDSGNDRYNYLYTAARTRESGRHGSTPSPARRRRPLS